MTGRSPSIRRVSHERSAVRRSVDGESMKNVFFAAAFAAAAILGVAFAAGPFDGQWTGMSPGTGGKSGCGDKAATISITDGNITGQYTQKSYTFPIAGTVAPDGTAAMSFNKNKLTGKFAGTHFTGSYDSPECGAGRPVTLEKKG